MQKVRVFRKCLFAAGFFAMFLAFLPARAHAASKEIIELQTQVQQLLDMVQRLQSTMDSRFGVLQNLAQQTSDNATQMNAAVNTLQQKIATQNEAMNSKLDAASGQAQSLNDSVDELKSRIAKLDKSIQDLQTQLQNIQNPPAGTAPATAPAPTGDTPAAAPAGVPGAAVPSVAQRPPLKETFQAGLRDYNAAKFDVAASEFQDVLHFYPMDDLAGTAHFYLGEIDFRRDKLSDAVKSYNAVLEGFPGNARAPAAQLKKGMALLQLGRKDAGIHELRLLIQRHPQTPEAAQARTKLNALGAKPAATAHKDSE